MSLVAHLGHDFLFSRFGPEFRGLANRPSQRLLTIHRSSHIHRPHGGPKVIVIRATDPNCIEIVMFIEKLAVVGVDLDVGLCLLGPLDLATPPAVGVRLGDCDKMLLQTGTDAGGGSPSRPDASITKLAVSSRSLCHIRQSHHRDAGPGALANELTAGGASLGGSFFHNPINVPRPRLLSTTLKVF